MPKEITIEELERLLASKEDLELEIQPDGSIKAVKKGTAQDAAPAVMDIRHLPSSY